jgi:hypothetical protein
MKTGAVEDHYKWIFGLALKSQPGQTSSRSVVDSSHAKFGVVYTIFADFICRSIGDGEAGDGDKSGGISMRRLFSPPTETMESIGL